MGEDERLARAPGGDPCGGIGQSMGAKMVGGNASLVEDALIDFGDLECHETPSTITCGLHLKHFRIAPAERDELLVCAFLNEAATFENHDAVSHADGGEAMRDEQRHFSFGQFGEA